MRTMSKSAKKFFAAAACISMLLVCFASCNQLNGGGKKKPTEQQKSADQQKPNNQQKPADQQTPNTPNNPADPQKSSEKQLLEFKFEKANNTDAGWSKDVKGRVNEKDHSVTIEVPAGTDKTKLKASFKISDKAKLFIGTVEQKSGETINDFSNTTDGVKLTVKAEDGTMQDYIVKVYVEIKILTFGFKQADNTPAISEDVVAAHCGPLKQQGVIRNVIIIKLPVGTTEESLKTLKPYFTVSPDVELFVKGAKLTSGTTAADFSTTVAGTTTAQSWGATIVAKASDGGSLTYTAVVEVDLETAPKAEVQKYFCSYYGVLESTFLGKNDVVAVLEENKVTIYSTAMSMDYVNVEWEKDGDKYHCTTYKTDYKVTPPKKMPQIKGMYGKGSYDFTEEGGKIIVKTNIMGTPVTLTKGEDFTWTEGSKYKKITYHL